MVSFFIRFCWVEGLMLIYLEIDSETKNRTLPSTTEKRRTTPERMECLQEAVTVDCFEYSPIFLLTPSDTSVNVTHHLITPPPSIPHRLYPLPSFTPDHPQTTDRQRYTTDFELSL